MISIQALYERKAGIGQRLPASFLLSVMLCLFVFKSNAQQTLPLQQKNFHSFSDKKTNWMAPAGNLAEVKEKRTANSRYFLNRDTAGIFYIQQSLGDIHFRKNGEWVAIDQRLSPVQKGIYEATQQAEPVGFDIAGRTSYIHTIQAEKISFNHWKLFGKKNGTLALLADADWSNFDAGDDGIYIHNIFPAIDAEMSISRSSVKTNFIIHRNVFNDIDSLLFLDIFSGRPQTGFVPSNNQLSGTFGFNGRPVLLIGSATGFVKNEPAVNFVLPYHLNNDSLSFSISVSKINTLLTRGKLVIDPLVSTTNSIAQAAITGSMYNGDCSRNNFCSYPMTIPTPAQATITDLRFSFGYRSTPPCLSGDGGFSIRIGNCGVFWTAIDPTYSGVTADFDKSIIQYFNASCFPPPSCTSQNMPVTLGFHRGCKGVAGCDGGCIGAEYPFILTLVGRTVELQSIGTTASSICSGSTTSLNMAGMYGVPPYTFNWNNSGGNTATVSVSPQANTIYTATVTDQCSNTATGTINITVKPVPVAIAAGNAPLCEGSLLNLTTQPVAGATYAWTGPNGFTSTLQNPSINNMLTGMSGMYISTVTLNGCISLPAPVNVQVSAPVIPLVNITTNSNTICQGAAATFTAVPVNGGTSPSFQWKINGINTGGNNAAFSSNTLSNNDIITCVMTSNAACPTPLNVTSNSIQVSVLPFASPTVSIVSSSVSICQGASVTFTANASNVGATPIFQWKVNGINTGANSASFSTSSLTDNSTVTCTVSGSLPCSVTPSVVSNPITIAVQPIITPAISIVANGNNACPGSMISFTAAPQYGGSNPVYQWMVNGIPAGGNNATFSSSQLEQNDGIKCMLTSNATCTSTSDAVSNIIIAQIKPTASRTVTTSICAGEQYEGYNSTGTYTDVFTGSNGCDSTRILQLTVKPHSASLIEMIICEGQSHLGYTTTGIYTDILTATNGCDSIRTLRLTVKPKSYSQLTATICEGEAYLGYTKQGTYTDLLVAANGCDSIRTLTLMVKPASRSFIRQTICEGESFQGHTTAGTYTDVFAAANGCDSIRTLELSVTPLPRPLLGKDTSICTGDQLRLYPGQFLTYRWQDGSSEQSFTATKAGLYNVTVTTDCGQATDEILISEKNCVIYFPTAFTPNNDGKNDAFNILNAFNLQDYQLVIFNRWGQKVFETRDYRKGWDGRLRGTMQDMGTFVWQCHFKKAGTEFNMKGVVTLVR